MIHTRKGGEDGKELAQIVKGWKMIWCFMSVLQGNWMPQD